MRGASVEEMLTRTMRLPSFGTSYLARLMALSIWLLSFAHDCCPLEADCNVLYSEDLQDGQVVDGLAINNPFALA